MKRIIGKVKTGWIILLILILLAGGAYVFDAAQAKTYEYELVGVSSEKFIADGASTVRISVKLSKRGKPVGGHTIYMYASNGTLPVSRSVTDEDGVITFKYYPYVYLNEELTPLEDVTIYFQDESNSIFFMVCAEGKFVFPVEKPESEGEQRDWQGLTTEGKND